MAKHTQLGIVGEQLAKRFLETKGYKILATNWRHEKSEIDIIALYNKQIVFIEVKTRSTRVHGGGHEAVTLAKQKKLIEGADVYMQSNYPELECRFDILSIYTDENNCIEHIENAFGPQW